MASAFFCDWCRFPLPIREGHIGTKYSAPAITAEQMYRQDTQIRNWEAKNRDNIISVAAMYRRENQPEKAKQILRELWR